MRPALPETRLLATSLAFILGTWVLASQPPAAAQSWPWGGNPTTRLVPGELSDESWLAARRDRQVEATTGAAPFHGFRFTDTRQASGITFRHRFVEDAGRAYKAVHYDHGNGLVVADVDGDGRLDIYFVNQAGPHELWRNRGDGRFENITGQAGVGLGDRVGVSAAFADIDNDGDADLFVTSVRGGNVLFENDGTGRFRDVTAQSGLEYSGHSAAAVFFDYNRDGRLDLFVANVGRFTTDLVAGAFPYYLGLTDAFSGHLMPERAEPSRLYRNEGGGRFVDVTASTGLESLAWTGDAIPIDVNEDGWPDLYVLNMQGDDQYFENTGGSGFRDRSREVFPKTPWGSMGVAAFDANADGRLDLYLTDMHSDMSALVGPDHEHAKSQIEWPEEFRGDGSTSIWGNALFLNDGNGQYTDASDAFNLETYWPWGPSIGDLNADGYDDVLVTGSMNYPFRYAVNNLKLNNGGRGFLDAEFLVGIEPRPGGLTTPWFSLDASGADRGHQDAQGLSGQVTIVGARGSRSAAIFDLDDDGDLDIVTGEFGTEPMVLVSDLTARRAIRFIKVHLTGTASNRNGLGAIVTVTAGGVRQTKVFDGRSGYLSNGLIPLYFGLGDARRIDSIEVQWPSGQRQRITSGLGVNRTVEITEP
jgi:hypothetical protein